MWFPRLPRPLQHPLAVVLGQLRDQIRNVGHDVAHILRDLHQLKELHVADFSNLNAKLDDLGAGLDNLEAEWTALKDQIANDTSDQSAVDAATARVDAALSRVRGVDLVPDAEQPTNPADNPNEPAAGTEPTR